MDRYPTRDGDFVLTNRTLIYRDPLNRVWTLPLASITKWQQQRSSMHRRLVDIDVHMSDGRQYSIETGKIFTKQIRKTGKIRRSR